MIGLSLEVTPLDGDAWIVPVTPRAAVEFERHWKLGMPKAFTDEQRLEHVLWLGWKCTHLAGHVVKPFDEWLDGITAVDFVAKDSRRPFAGGDSTTPTSA